MIRKRFNAEEILKNSQRILDTIYKQQRGYVYFVDGKNEKQIEYFKLVAMEKDYDRSLYFKNIEEKITHSEWVFQIGRPYEFSFETATRFQMTETNFIKQALLQVDNSCAVQVKEELEFDVTRTPNTLQYLKILSTDKLEKELYFDSGKHIFGYKNGERYSLNNLEKVKNMAATYNGTIVKVTETFYEEI